MTQPTSKRLVTEDKQATAVAAAVSTAATDATSKVGTETSRATDAETALQDGTNSTFETRLSTLVGDGSKVVLSDTPPTDLDKIWIDIGTVGAGAGNQWQKDVLPVTIAGTVTATLKVGPITGSLIVARKRSGTWSLLEESDADYTLTGVTLSVPSCLVGDKLRVQYGYAGGLIGGPTVTDQPIVIDTFTRTNSTTTLGTADTGHAWTVLSGTWGISSNQAYLPTPSGDSTTNDVAYVDPGISDYVAEVTIATQNATAGPGVAARIVDAANCIIPNSLSIFRRTAGVNTSLATFSTAFASGDVMRIVCKGSSIKVYRQAAAAGAFSLVADVTETQGQTSTKVGIRTRTNSLARLDNFKVYAA